MAVSGKNVISLLLGMLVGVVISPMTMWLFMSRIPVDFPAERTAGLCDKPSLSLQNHHRDLRDTSSISTNNAILHGPLTHDTHRSDLRLVGISVLSSSKHLHSRATAAFNTYGRSTNDFKVYTFPTGVPANRRKKPTHTKRESFSIKYMKTIENATHPKSHFAHLLDHVCLTNGYANYHFLFLVRDNTYVHVANLRRLANSLLLTKSPPLYTALQANTTHITTDTQLPPNGRRPHYCKTSNGVLIHRNAFDKICSNLHLCTKQAGSSTYDKLLHEDQVTSECLYTILQTSCWSPEKAEILFHHDKDDKLKRSLNTGTADSHTIPAVDHSALHEVVTIQPITDSNQYSLVHSYISQIQVDSLLKQTESVIDGLFTLPTVQQQSEDSVTGPIKAPLSINRKWALAYQNNNPKTKHELLIWQYTDMSTAYQVHEYQPSLGLLNRHRKGIQNAIQVAIRKLNNTNEAGSELLLPGTHQIQECYYTLDESTGMKYVIRFTIKKAKLSSEDGNGLLSYIAGVTLPFQSPLSHSVSRPGKGFTDTVINLILPIAHYHNLMPFLEMYENECLASNERVYLHLVFFTHDEVVRRKVSQIEHIYSLARVKMYDIPGKKSYSVPYAYNYIAQKLPDSELMLLYDVGFRFTGPFLSHCRMNSIRGKQVYSPILFSQYKRELADDHTNPLDMQSVISSTNGFFLRYNYQAMCIYRSDFAKVGGYKRWKSASSAPTQAPNEETQLMENILRSSIYFMRSLEPYLTKPFRSRKCDDLKSKVAQESCTRSVADSIGSKKALGMYLLHNNCK